MKSIADNYMTMLIESLLRFEQGAETTMDDVVALLYQEKEEILSKLKADYVYKADHVLISDDIEGDIQKIVKAKDSDPHSMIDYIDGITVCEDFEYSFSPAKFLAYIGYK